MSNMAGKGELTNLKSKKTRSRAGSKKSGKGSGMSASEGGLEDNLKDLERQEGEVEEELEKLSVLDGHSKVLHVRQMAGEIEFLEDIAPEEKLEDESVWEEEQGRHEKEDKIIATRLTRLARRQELMEIKDQIRRNRLHLVTEEKKLDMEEKRRQMETRAQWLKLQKEEMLLEREWQTQQEEYDEFQKVKRIDGWVANTVAQAGLVPGEPNKVVKGVQPVGKSVGPQELLEEAKLLKNNFRESGAPLGGVDHLQRMGMLPAYGIDPGQRTLPLQQRHGPLKEGGKGRDGLEWDQLSKKLDQGKEVELVPVEDGGRGEHGEKGDTKHKIKSGKFAKSHVELVREESWPHLNVLRQYSKRTSFDNMEFDSFVAGETRIIASMMHREEERACGRLKVLCRVAHWVCKCNYWPAVRNIYEAIIESIEMGDADWWNSFDNFESLLPPPMYVLEKLKKEDKKDEKKDKDGKRTGEVFWCRDYQRGMCTENSPHSCQLKADEKPVTVVHICAVCWQKEKKKRDHPESDTGCPHKKA